MLLDVHGVKAKPRVLLVKEPEGEGLSASDLDFIPTVREVTVAELKTTRLGEWDVAILYNVGTFFAAGKLRCIVFGDKPFADRIVEGRGREIYSCDGSSTAEEFAVPANVPEDVKTLVINDILPELKKNRSNPTLRINLGFPSFPERRKLIEAFVSDLDDNPYVGVCYPYGPEQPIWFVPRSSSPALWVRAALRLWAIEDAARFAIRQDWTRDPLWASPQEVDLLRREAEAVAAFREAASAHEQERALLQTELRHISATESTSGRRRLLTEAASSLVAAVSASLEFLGFEVIDRDRDQGTKGVKLEDLLVRDGRWVSVVEVRGYKGGASTNDLLRLGRFATSYAAREGRPPDAVWYITNQFRFEPPQDRPTVLRESESQVQEFGVGGGLVIDTAVLFQLLNDVEVGVIDPSEARGLIKNTSGRLVYNPIRDR